MQSTPREQLLRFSHVLQSVLFERLEPELGPLGPKARLLVAVISLLELSRCVAGARGWRGRPSKDRQALATAFLAKAIYGLETTRQMLARLRTDRQLRCLCGWNTAQKIPHESTFSRAFAEFAHSELPQRLHEALIHQTQQDRLIGHIARDSTAIEARERFPENPPSKPTRQKHKRGPRRKRTMPPAARTRIEEQRLVPASQMLSELPRHCSLGVKKSSKGHQQYWRGYKLHLDVADGQIPITALLTGACLHDSQVAIPLMTLTSQRVTYLYELMDAAYDANAIDAHSRSLGHIPLIALNGATAPISKLQQDSLRGYDKRRKAPTHYGRKRLPFTPAQEQRFELRTMVERVYSRLKDEFGARFIRVRGASKIMAHLMFGVLALTVDQLLKLTG
jgi:transposase